MGVLKWSRALDAIPRSGGCSSIAMMGKAPNVCPEDPFSECALAIDAAWNAVGRGVAQMRVGGLSTTKRKLDGPCFPPLRRDR